MKLDCSITILFNNSGLEIEARDESSNITFLRIKMNPEQVCKAFSRLACTPCQSMKVFDLDKVGKEMEHKTFEFPMPGNPPFYKQNQKIIAIETMNKICPPGCVPDNHFNSQNSFFFKDETLWARTIIRRWIMLPEKDG